MSQSLCRVLQASKHMTCGEGGMLLIKDGAKADFIRRFSCLGYGSVSGKKQKVSDTCQVKQMIKLMRLFGQITRSDLQDPLYNRHMCLGYNFRMSELQVLRLRNRTLLTIDLRQRVHWDNWRG